MEDIFVITKHCETFEEDHVWPDGVTNSMLDYCYYISLEDAKEEINKRMPKGEWIARISFSKQIYIKRKVSEIYDDTTKSRSKEITEYHIYKMEPKQFAIKTSALMDD